MKKGTYGAAMLLGAALLAVTGSAVEYGRDSRMILPKDYREWVFLSSGIGMSYQAEGKSSANPNFDNVFVNPEAYREFMKSGTWPDKTVMMLEVRASDSKVSINKDGRVQTRLVGLEAHVKDAAHGGWAFYAFGDGTQQEGTLFPKSAACYTCHEQNGAVDTTFVQFYPTLEGIARSKGTFKIASEGANAGAQTAPKRFALAGTVQSVDAQQHKLVVQHGEIPGFMLAMTMPYRAGKSENLAKVSTGDGIHADVVVNADETHLENIVVTSRGK